MPGKLAKHLPQLSAADREALFGSITDVTKYPRGNPIREGVIGGKQPSSSLRIISNLYCYESIRRRDEDPLHHRDVPQCRSHPLFVDHARLVPRG